MATTATDAHEIALTELVRALRERLPDVPVYSEGHLLQTFRGWPLAQLISTLTALLDYPVGTTEDLTEQIHLDWDHGNPDPPSDPLPAPTPHTPIIGTDGSAWQMGRYWGRVDSVRRTADTVADLEAQIHCAMNTGASDGWTGSDLWVFHLGYLTGWRDDIMVRVGTLHAHFIECELDGYDATGVGRSEFAEINLTLILSMVGDLGHQPYWTDYAIEDILGS